MDKSRLKFYDIDEAYINYLKKFEPKVPNVSYDGQNNKFFCGIVLQIGEFQYFAPISSKIKKTDTSMVITDKKGEELGSIRFNFMIPAIPGVLTLKDFQACPSDYRNLLNKEIQFCNRNRQAIRNKANQAYRYGTNKKHYLAQYCCDFKLLEEKAREYFSSEEDVAATAPSLHEQLPTSSEFDTLSESDISPETDKTDPQIL